MGKEFTKKKNFTGGKVISMFLFLKMAPVGAKSSCGWGWGAMMPFWILPFSYYLDIKQLIQRSEWIDYKIGRSEVSVLSNQTCFKEKCCLYIYIYIYIYIRSVFNKFPDFFVQAFKIIVDSLKFSMYCYTSYEMTDQFLWFQLQINSYSSNWNTPY